jgi:RNA polymerase sigma factor (sigma-70 family)
MAELTEVDVEAVVRRARAGDRDALGELYDRFRDRVARFATGRLGDPEKAEDVTSETFEVVLRGLAAYRPGTDFEAWLFTIAHRRVSDHFRRQARRGEVELDEGAQPAVGGPEDAVLAAALLLLVAALPSLGAALADLGGPEPAGGATATTAPGQGQSPPPDTGAEGSTPAGRSDGQQGDPEPGLDDDGDQAGDDAAAAAEGPAGRAD